MKALDPEKVYSKTEIQNLISTNNITDINQLLKKKMGQHGHGFGNIINKIGDNYILFHELTNAHIHHFSK